MLLLDDRESARTIKKIQEAIPAATVQRLTEGDFLFMDQDGHTLGIERKEVGDLLSSMGEGKLKRQLSNLGVYTEGLLLIEGHWSLREDGRITLDRGRDTGWYATSAQMILWKLQKTLPFEVLHTSGITETVRVLKVLEGRAETGCVLEAQRR